MPALNFPSSPTLGDVYSANGLSYVFNGTSWVLNKRRYSYKGQYLSTTAGGEVVVDLSKGNFFYVNLTKETTVSFINRPTANFAQKFHIKMITSPQYEYTPWSLSRASFTVGNSYVIGTQTTVRGPFFSSDGTKMYIGSAGTSSGSIIQYQLSTPWKVSTAVYSVSFDTTPQSVSTMGISFNTDGSKLYILSDNNTIHQYTLSVPWDIYTATYDNISVSIGTQDSLQSAIYLKSDGTKLYTIGRTNDTVYQYSMSTPWNISTVSYDSVSFSIASQEVDGYGISFSSTGNRMYVTGMTNKVFEYNLASPWVVSSSSLSSSYTLFSTMTNAYGLYIRQDGVKMYAVEKASTYYYVLEYDLDLPTAIWPSYMKWETRSKPTAPSESETDVLEFHMIGDGTMCYGKLIEENIK